MDFLKMFKQLGQIKSKADSIEKRLIARKIEVNTNGIYILANAKKEILDIKIDQELYKNNIEKLQTALLLAIKQALNESQKVSTEEIKSEMGGMDMGSLQNLINS